MREILMYKINSDGFAVSKLKRKLLSGCADMFDIPSLVRYVGIITDCIASFKTFSSQRVLCECALIKLASPKVNTDFDSVLARIDSLENKLNYIQNNPVMVNAVQKEESVVSESSDDIPLPPEPPVYEDEIPVNSPESVSHEGTFKSTPDGSGAKIIAAWNDVMGAISSKGQLRVFTALFGIKPIWAEGKLVVSVADEDKRRFLSDKAVISTIKECIKETLGVDCEVGVTGEFVQDTEKTDDIFASLGDIGKNFPSNININ
jgi:hypothetical protein